MVFFLFCILVGRPMGGGYSPPAPPWLRYWILTTKTGFQPGWRRFFFFFYYLEIVYFWTEKPSQLQWRPFFSAGDHLNFDRNADSIWMQTNQNLGQVRLLLFPASTTPPPQCKFLATRLSQMEIRFGAPSCWTIKFFLIAIWKPFVSSFVPFRDIWRN